MITAGVVYRAWSSEEDQRLAELVERFGARNWALSEWVGQVGVGVALSEYLSERGSRVWVEQCVVLVALWLSTT